MRSLLTVLALSLTMACADVPSADPISASPAVDAPADAPDQANAEVTQAAPTAIPAAIEGDWSFDLDEAQQARHQVLTMALAEAPPTASELAAAKLDGVSANQVDTLLATRTANANAPEIDVARTELKMLTQRTWQLKDGMLNLMVDGGAVEGYGVKVLEATDTEVKVSLADSLGTVEEATIEIVSPTQLIVHRGQGDLTLNR